MRHDFKDEVVTPNLLLCDGDIVRREVALLRQAVLEHGIGIVLRICRKLGVEFGTRKNIGIIVKIENIVINAPRLR